MEIEIKRKVKKEVEETVIVELRKYWVVRVIQGECGKSCIAEKEFDYIPSEQEIADTIAPYIKRKCFATVVDNYRFVERVEGAEE